MRIVICRAWNTYRDPYFRTFPKVKSYQHFEFDSSHPGVVTARKEHDSLESTTFQILKHPDNLPPAALCPLDLPPPGLDAIRQTYLHDNIRQYCDEHAHDITCPKPTKTCRTEMYCTEQNSFLKKLLNYFFRGLWLWVVKRFMRHKLNIIMFQM